MCLEQVPTSDSQWVFSYENRIYDYELFYHYFLTLLLLCNRGSQPFHTAYPFLKFYLSNCNTLFLEVMSSSCNHLMSTNERLANWPLFLLFLFMVQRPTDWELLKKARKRKS